MRKLVVPPKLDLNPYDPEQLCITDGWFEGEWDIASEDFVGEILLALLLGEDA